MATLDHELIKYLDVRYGYAGDDSFDLAEKGSVVIYNVQASEFGAKGDGTTDDTTAIQNAINAATSGGIIFFPQGTYLISTSLELGNNMILEGVGDASILYAANTSNATLIRIINVSNVKVRNIQINGNYANQTSGALNNDVLAEGVRTNGADHVEISNCYIHDTYNEAIHSEKTTNMQIHDNRIHNTPYGGGIFLHNDQEYGTNVGCSNVIIKNNIVDMAGYYGITAIRSDYITIVGNDVYNNGQYDNSQGYGIDLEGSRYCVITGNNSHDGHGGIICRQTLEGGARNCSYVVISGNTCYNNTPSGTHGEGSILVANSDYVLVDGNNLSNSPVGINITSATETTIQGNSILNHQGTGIYSADTNCSNIRILNNYVAANTSSGIQIIVPFTSVIGNVIRDNNGEGVNVLGGANNSVISNNHIYDNTDNGISMGAATNVIVKDNIFDNSGTAQGRALYEGSGGGPTYFINNRSANQNNVDFSFSNSSSYAKNNNTTKTLDHNSGSASFSAVTSVTVSHGLYKAPTIQQIVLMADGNAGQPWITNITSTQFTINVPASFTGNIGWSADLAR